jgi:hypothetical protein
VAAAEEILVPMDDSILAGSANPAIAFRDKRVMFLFEKTNIRLEWDCSARLQAGTGV